MCTCKAQQQGDSVVCLALLRLHQTLGHAVAKQTDACIPTALQVAISHIYSGAAASSKLLSCFKMASIQANH
jgi:hypothetical protein